jgi:hypothetical protein
VDLGYAKILGILILRRTRFRSSVNFNCATIHSLSLAAQRDDYDSGSLSFNEEEGLDLRRCTFDIFEGTKDQQERVVKAQSPQSFSMDPYLQFERYYRSIGDEAYAKKIYYEGRTARRKNTLGWSMRSLEWLFLGLTVGYGVRMRRLLVWMIPVLVLGIVIFWSDSTLVAKESGKMKTKSSSLEQMNPAKEAEQSPDGYEFLKHLGHRLWYSLDLFIPIVNLRIAEEYQRPHGLRGLYFVLHIAMGWILVPLLIASLSGVVRK